LFCFVLLLLVETKLMMGRKAFLFIAIIIVALILTQYFQFKKASSLSVPNGASDLLILPVYVDTQVTPIRKTAAPVSSAPIITDPPINTNTTTAPMADVAPISASNVSNVTTASPVAIINWTKKVLSSQTTIECQGDGLRNCTDHAGGVRGAWVHEKNRTFAAPVCCAWDETFRPFNDPEKCSKDINSNNYRGVAAPLHQQIGGYACSCARKRNYTDEHVWKAAPDGLLDDFDFCPHKACNLLGTRQVLLVGDSTMQQTASTLMNALLPGGCQTQILLRVSDTLTGKRFGAGFRGQSWNRLTLDQKPDIVIISTGAHVFGGDQGYIDNLQNILANVPTIRQRLPGTKVVWKTQQPGGCSNDVRYHDDPAKASKTLTLVGRKYNHADFYDRDLYTISQMQKHGVPVLDMRMLYSRSDSHPSSGQEGHQGMDCLHMCSPGPLDVIAPLFQNLLAHLG
jgi:hypothetical protein